MDQEGTNLIMAISAVVVAASTVAVAVFGVGTLKLYRLERGRQEAQETRLVALLVRLSNDVETWLRVSEEALNEGVRPNLEKGSARSERHLTQVRRGWELAADFGEARAMAHLAVAEVAAENVLDAWAEIEKIPNRKSSPTGMARTAEILNDSYLPPLRQLKGAVEAAYGALPRAWGERAQYAELLDDAASDALDLPTGTGPAELGSD